MLAAAFFFSVFTTFIWIFYAFSNLSNENLSQFAFTSLVIVLPIFILWAIFGYIYQYIGASVLNKNMYSLFKQIKKNQELSDAIARILLEARGTLQDNIVLGKFDVFIADMNELLADIIKRSQLLPEDQVDNLWIKVKNGGKWAFGKVIIDIAQTQPNMPNKLLQKALNDVVLSGTILEFCSRYQSLVSALEKHDQARLFLNIVETGVLGKVFSLFAMPADSIRQNRDLTIAHQQMTNQEPEKEVAEIILPELSSSSTENEENITSSNKDSSSKISENARRLFVNTFRKKNTPDKEKTELEDKDPLSVAFAKSFGPSFSEEKKQPHFEKEILPEDDDINLDEKTEQTETSVDSEEFYSSESVSSESTDSEETISSVVTPELTVGFQNTQEKLASLKKEWEDAKQRDLSALQNISDEEGMPEPKISNDSDFSYPFGGWMNANNYDK